MSDPPGERHQPLDQLLELEHHRLTLLVAMAETRAAWDGLVDENGMGAFGVLLEEL